MAKKTSQERADEFYRDLAEKARARDRRAEDCSADILSDAKYAYVRMEDAIGEDGARAVLDFLDALKVPRERPL